MRARRPIHIFRRSVALIAAATILAAATAQAQVVSTLILRTGDVAPQLGTAPVTIESFVEPPSIVGSAGLAFDDSYMPIHVTVAGETVTPLNTHVIYRWTKSTSLQRVARGGDVASFPEGVRAFNTIESPIATPSGAVMFTAPTDRPGRGLFMATPGTLVGLVEVGQAVSIECESVSGAPCGPVAGTLATMATFGDRRGAAAQSFSDLSGDNTSVGAAFRGFVQTSGFGMPDALWFQSYFDGQRGPLVNQANSLLKAGGITGTTTYYDDFTDVAVCLGPPIGQYYDLFALATVSQGAPLAIYHWDAVGGPDLLLRHHAPDLVARRDFHCGGGDLAFAGGVTSAPLNGDTSTRGVWSLDRNGSSLTQVYRANSTPAPGIAGAALGPPIGQALVAEDEESVLLPDSVFAANLVGSPLAGAASVWRGTTVLQDPYLLAHEQQATSYGSPIQTIWGVHVNARGDVAFHVRLQDQRQAIFVIDINDRIIPVLLAGNPLPGVPDGSVIMDSFWTLGVTFGADPVVTGSGLDGIQSAFSADGEIPVVVYTRQAGQPPGSTNGAALLHVAVPLPPRPPLFADGFESPPPPE